MADPAIIIAAVASALGGLLGGGGIVRLIEVRRQGPREQRQDIWDSFKRQIESAETRKDSVEVDRLRREYEAQEEAWRAQQDLVELTPKELSPPGAEPSLSTQEVAQLKRLLDEADALSPSLLSADDYFARGNAHYEAGQYHEALAAYNRTVELQPDDPNILSNRGNALGNLSRYEDGLADHNRALNLRPDDPTTLNNRGAALSNLGRHEDSLADFNRSLELRPDHPDTLYNRGTTLYGLARYDDAIADYDRALELRPDHPMTLNNRGIVLANLGRYEDAFADFNRSLELRAGHPGTLYNRARLFALWSKPDQAVDNLRRAIQGDAKKRADARTDPAFDSLHADPRFKELVGEEPSEPEDAPAP